MCAFDWWRALLQEFVVPSIAAGVLADGQGGMGEQPFTLHRHYRSTWNVFDLPLAPPLLPY